jgi:hypothetical protein
MGAGRLFAARIVPMARVKLRAPVGTTEASVGTTLFPVHDDGTIEVSEAEALTLTGIGGFTAVEPEPAPLPAGVVELRGNPSDGFNWRGHALTVGADGLLLVPGNAVDDLTPHGLVINRTGSEVVTQAAAAYSGPLAPSGLAILIGEPNSGCSWMGQAYTADGDGAMLVPEAALADLMAHGFRLPDAVSAEPAPVAEPQPMEPMAPVEPEPAHEPMPEPEPLAAETSEPAAEPVAEPQAEA